MSTIPSQCVMDASVVMKYLLHEAETPYVRRIVDILLKDEFSVIAVPDLLFVECSNVLWKRVQRKEFDFSIAEQYLEKLTKLEFSVTPISELHTRALSLACDYQITAYDACYLALAERLSLPLLIADARLAAQTTNAPITVITLASLMSS